MGSAERQNPFNQWRDGSKDGISQFKLYDGYGREIGKDDLLLWPGKTHVEWRVQEIRPSLDPRVIGLTVTLVAAAVITVPGGTPVTDLAKVLDAEQVREKLKQIGQTGTFQTDEEPV